LGSAHAESYGTSTAYIERGFDTRRSFGPRGMGEGPCRPSFARRSVDEGEQVGGKLAQPEQVFAEFRKGWDGRLFEWVGQRTRGNEWDGRTSSSTFTGGYDAPARRSYWLDRDQHSRRTWRISRDHVPVSVNRPTDELAFALPRLAAYELVRVSVPAHARRSTKL
jgi:hypothetical protein